MGKKYYLTPDQENWLISNYSNLGGRSCATELRISMRSVHGLAKRRGLRVSPESVAKNSSKNRMAACAVDLEKRGKKAGEIEVTTPEMAYVLGFLWGDGNIRSPKNGHTHYAAIEIKSSDFDVIKASFETLGKWSCSNRKRGNRKMQTVAVLCDPVFGLFLVKNDYKDKSRVAPTKILGEIPDKFKHFWWRGYVDADGCFYKYDKEYLRQFSLAGAYDQDWSEFEKLLTVLGISDYSVKRREQKRENKPSTFSSVVRTCSVSEIKKIGSYIYGGKIDGVCLPRKRNKFLEIAGMAN